ncbi:MAG TPA: nuclear transport factor 2 family protein [Acidimicrobiales bacterium]|nr:nuclear transport factor 2 family protein [Acidimicrobiales bacterium]
MTPEDLVEIELVKRLKYRYLRCLDQKEWDELATCFTPDATAAYGGGAHRYDGREAIMEFLRTSMGATTMLTSHRCHHPEIDLTGPTTAEGTWALEDVVVLVDVGVTVQGAAFYSDRYVKVDGAWLIAHTGYRRTYEEIFPRASIEGLKLTAQWWATDGRSKLS